MEAPELTNFGSLIRFALGLEASTAAFYATAARLLGPGQKARVAEDLASQHEGRRALLERTRQQKLNEMVLEPITGLDGARYLFNASVAATGEVPGKAVALEEVGALFYGESAIEAKSLLTEAARTFRKLAEQNRQNLVVIRETFQA